MTGCTFHPPTEHFILALLFIVNLVGFNCNSNLSASIDFHVPSDVYRKPCVYKPWTTNWNAIEDMSTQRAGFYTPYHITMGGGERYFLSAVKAAQSHGFYTDILVAPDNICQTVAEVRTIAEMMRIELDYNLLNLVPAVQIPEGYYDMFFLLGNEKVPEKKGVGKINFYMCQFPFDLDRPTSETLFENFLSYEYILLNSIYSMKWFINFTQPLLERATTNSLVFPSLEVLYPPVLPFPSADGEHKHIILLGRFFSGRQSKGHLEALRAFKLLSGKIPASTKLILCGNVWPGHSDYVELLKREVARDNLNVEFLLGQSSAVVQSALQSSLVQWHMTGIDAQGDPASNEHFGISIVEGMSTGCIPIVYCIGGGLDIVQHKKNGFVACSVRDFAELTLSVFHMPEDEIIAMRLNSLDTVGKFTYKMFASRFDVMMHRAKLTRPFRLHLSRTGSIVSKLPLRANPKAKYAAVIIEGRPHFAFSYVVRSTMWMLSGDWHLHVFHSLLSEDFVKFALKDIPGTEFNPLDVTNIDIPYYNALLKSPEFWDTFSASKILIFQTDALLLRPGIEPFLDSDYIGAPWHQENERWSLMKQTMPEGVGNGGLSIRSVSCSRYVASKHGKEDTEQEDVFFVRHFLNLNFTVAKRKDAFEFCLEVPIHELNKTNHLAVHAAWYYHSPRVVGQLLDASMDFIPQCS